ncbi:CTD small phosphatase [Micractinium conductrix]|uniref:CTD small phosphatase n=1 Tax=Micractinium conductrix TaxID=554055 RepID=A0A2P6V964_9CHLO|nr:CTD small phosphatase [Micractinium conductrix]|eukprot:PSC70630.1 CTD small phosphatase [Micractinium conductrix]
MKFGKRLQREAERRPELAHAYLNYKALKAALKADVAAQDLRGSRFEAALRAELRKVAGFYSEKEEELGAAMARLSLASSLQEVSSLRAELQVLRKYVALNYVATIKAAKKRNKMLGAAARAAGGVPPPPLRALAVLQAQRFYTSPRLAQLTTQAEVLAQELAPSRQPASEVLSEQYQCPICWDTLRSPVVLTCSHRLCWGCALAYFAANKRGPAAPEAADAKKQGQVVQEQAAAAASGTTVVEAAQQAQQEQQEQAEDAQSVCTTFDCPVCRKAQLLDLERLHVDPHLDAFLQRLERQQQRSGGGVLLPGAAAASSGDGAAAASTQPIPIAAASGAAAAAAAAATAADGVEAMVLDPQPTSAARLAEASDSLAQAAAAEQQQQRREPAAAGSGAEVILEVPAAELGEPALLPPQRPEHRGRLVVCLDLDGTLVSTFSPKRAPLLPPGMVSYIVGRNSKLNPGGVFVVERPGLGEFLQRIAPFSEVVLFTAGLQDYALPICDAIEARYPGAFHHRLYRTATVADPAYPCVKDMARLGRDLNRCVLVDDTPLAFFRQPDHGIPVLQFRGDADDRMLPEAVAPLLEQLHGSADVSAPLARRFDMQKWFAAQGLAPPVRALALPRTASVPQIKALAPPAPAPRAPAVSRLAADASATELLRQSATAGTLLVTDFDHTLTAWDAGERLCEELAPELTSLLSSLEMPACFIPATNAVLAEMHRRGVSRDRLVGCLREMGREVPLHSVQMLQYAARRGVPTVILSDCNSVFISAILAGARANTSVRHVITNSASFHRVPMAEGAAEGADAAATPPARGAGGWGGFFRPSSAAAASKPPLAPTQRCVVEPRHGGAPHGCPLCPSNLCKGRELAALRAAAPGQRVIYAGDGANDLCPSLSLGPDDVVLARAGFSLERLLGERAAGPEEGRPRAAVHAWHTHEELFALFRKHV